MKKMLLLFSHKLLQNQEEDARKTLGVRKFIYLEKRLQDLWSNIPSNLRTISQYLVPIKNWVDVNSSQGDYVLVQGDFGAVYIMVNYSFDKGLIPVYSTTKRMASEMVISENRIINGKVFEHEIFRFYEKG